MKPCGWGHQWSGFLVALHPEAVRQDHLGHEHEQAHADDERHDLEEPQPGTRLRIDRSWLGCESRMPGHGRGVRRGHAHHCHPRRQALPRGSPGSSGRRASSRTMRTHSHTTKRGEDPPLHGVRRVATACRCRRAARAPSSLAHACAGSPRGDERVVERRRGVEDRRLTDPIWLACRRRRRADSPARSFSGDCQAALGMSAASASGDDGQMVLIFDDEVASTELLGRRGWLGRGSGPPRHIARWR